jgi:hypothetical protein
MSLPTMSLISLFMIATVAAKETSHLAKVDAVGAYLNPIIMS